MEYEKPPTAPVFPRKLRNRSHSLSFSTNVVYDGVFASPATKTPPPAIDYGEIFRGSGPSSSSSIPFLDVPELNEEKIKVDVRSSKLDYSSVFGGSEGCDFTVSPEELIIKSERKNPAEEDKRNGKKAGLSSDVPPTTKAKNMISSPEVVSMKQFSELYHQTAPGNENGMNGRTQVAWVHAVSGYTQLIDSPCTLPKMESRTPISSVEKEPCNRGPVEVAECNNVLGRGGSNVGDCFTNSVCKTDCSTKHPDVTRPSSSPGSIHGDKEASERSTGPKSGVSETCPYEEANSPCSVKETDANSAAAALKKAIEEAQLRINIAKRMMEREKAGFRSRAKARTSDSLKVEDKCSRKLEQQADRCRDDETKSVDEAVNFSTQSFALKGESILGKLVNYSKQLFPNAGKLNVGEVVNSSEQLFPDGREQKTGKVVNSSEQSIPNEGEQNVGEVVSSSEQSIPEKGEQNNAEPVNSSEQSFPDNGEQNFGEAINSSEKSILSEGEQDVCEVVNSSEISIPCARERKVGEAENSSEHSISNREEPNVGEAVNSTEQSFPYKGGKNVGEVVDSSEQSFPNQRERNLGEVNSSEQPNLIEEKQNVGEDVSSSEQLFPDPGEQQVKRARKLWEVPGGILKSTLHHTQGAAREHEVIKEEEEHARKARKHWEIPGGLFKSTANGKQHETENLVSAEHATDTNTEMQKATENSFYSFGQLGNKIKCVVKAFTGSKVVQKSEAEGTEHAIIDSNDNSNPSHEVLYQEGEEKILFEQENILVGSSDTEICEREVEEILKPTDSQSPTQRDEDVETTMNNFTEECSQKEEKATEWYKRSENPSGSYNTPLVGVKDNHANSYLTHEILSREGEKESLSEPQEALVGPADTKTNEREVEEIPRPTQSTSKTETDENAGSMVSILTENASVSGDAPVGNEKQHKTPRRRRVWKTSEDVYDMIKGLKRYNRALHLEEDEKEMMKRCLREQSATVDDGIDGEETETMSELPTELGVQENWNVLKQMFRQMFQTVDTNREDRTCCLVGSEQKHVGIHQRAERVGRKGTPGSSNYELAGADILDDAYKQDTMETVRTGYEAYVPTSGTADPELALKTYFNKDDGEVEEQNRSSFVYELIGEELEDIEMDNNPGAEDVPEASEAADLDQEAFELDIKEQACSQAGILEHDQNETYSSNSDEKFELKPFVQLAEETKVGGSIDDGTRRLSFESGQGDIDSKEVGVEQNVYDRCPENISSISSMEEHVEEVDSESNKSGWDVEDMEFNTPCNENDDNLKSGASQPSCKPEEAERAKQKFEDNEGKQDSECPEEFDSRSNTEAATSPSSSKEDEEKFATENRNMEEKDREDRSRPSVNEERDATLDASRSKTERAEKLLKKIDEAKEKEKEREKERIMVERAIREARERAFAEARERAERAAMKKANAGTHRRANSEVGGRSEKASAEANGKLSSAEKASMQAKLRAERAAVERALAEARERALEKALSGKAASQARGQGSKSSSGSSGERRGFSSSGTENRSSAPPLDQSGNGEPAQRSERHQRTAERAAKALAEKKLRDLIAQKEQAERNKLAETLDAEVKRWSSGKEGNLRALLSTLQYILGPESGWKPIHLTDLVSSAAVRKAYRKATLYVHPDKLQQRGATTKQKYICEKVFDLLKEAWNKFSVEER